jgi:hypothetical protein
MVMKGSIKYIESHFTVDLFIPNSNKHYLEITDTRGRLIKNEVISKTIGRHYINLDLTDISTGEYLLTLNNNSHIAKTKIIKQ